MKSAPKIATSPGDNARRGNASLLSRFFIGSITQRKAAALNTAFINSITKAYDDVESIGALKKNGIENNSVTMLTKKEKSRAFNVNNDFFSATAANAENTAEINAK